MLIKIITLTGTTSIAQIVGVLSFPIISRQITPEEFGLFYFYSSISGLIGGVATLKIEQLFFSEKSDRINFLRIKSYDFIYFIFFALLLIVIFLMLFFKGYVSDGFVLLPIGVLATAIIIPNYFYLLHYSEIKKISVFKILLALLQAALQIIFCYIFPNYISLLVGLFIAQLISAYYLSYKVGEFNKTSDQVRIEDKKIRLDYRTLFHGMIASSFTTLNISFIPSYFTLFKYIDLGGFVAALHRIFMLPVNLVASNLSHIFLSEYKGNSKKMIDLLIVLIFLSFIIAVLMLMNIDYVNNFIIWYLGKDWESVTDITSIFVVIYSLIFISVIVNQLCIAARMQNIYMYMEILKIISTVVAFIVPILFINIYLLDIYMVLVSAGYFIGIFIPLFILKTRNQKNI